MKKRLFLFRTSYFHIYNGHVLSSPSYGIYFAAYSVYGICSNVGGFNNRNQF